MNDTNTRLIPVEHQQLGARIKYIREKMNISRNELGKLLNVSYQQIQKYESGQNRISAANLNKISKALNLPISLFFEKDLDLTDSSHCLVDGRPIESIWEQLPDGNFKFWIKLALKSIANDYTLKA